MLILFFILDICNKNLHLVEENRAEEQAKESFIVERIRRVHSDSNPRDPCLISVMLRLAICGHSIDTFSVWQSHTLNSCKQHSEILEKLLVISAVSNEKSIIYWIWFDWNVFNVLKIEQQRIVNWIWVFVEYPANNLRIEILNRFLVFCVSGDSVKENFFFAQKSSRRRRSRRRRRRRRRRLWRRLRSNKKQLSFRKRIDCNYSLVCGFSELICRKGERKRVEGDEKVDNITYVCDWVLFILHVVVKAD